MKRNILILSLLLMTFKLSAQDFPFKKGTYGIDHEKKMVVVAGPSRGGVETLEIDGASYRLYRSTMPVITIATDGPIVNTPAVHGIINVADNEGNVIEMHAGFKIRGNSSQQYDKKSYRVELWSDATGTLMADTTFLGLRSDDDWNLEAMWTEPLRLRNKVCNELWMEMYQLPYQENEPDARPGIRMQFADLFVNDEYVGIYTLTERMDRKQLGLRKYNGDLRGVLYKGNGNGAPSFDSLPDYDNTSDTWENFEWVYPNESDTLIDWSQLYSFVNFVINASDNVFYSQYATQFDVDNAIDYYIFINVLGAMDNMSRNTFIARYKKSSTYMYLPWDMDAVLGLNLEGEHHPDATGLKSNGFFDRLDDDCYDNGFVQRLQARYNELRNSILTTEHFMEMFRGQYETLLAEGAYDREHEAWPMFSADESELSYMEAWLESRFQYLDAELNAGCGTWAIEEQTAMEMEIFPNPAKDKLTIRFAESCESAYSLYDMTGRRLLSGKSKAQAFTVSTEHFQSGIYTIVVVADGKQHVERVVVE